MHGNEQISFDKEAKTERHPLIVKYMATVQSSIHLMIKNNSEMQRNNVTATLFC